MRNTTIFVLLIGLLFADRGQAAREEQKTVCTITVNSADEKEALRERLPRDRYRFVELVEKGRADWLGSACEKRIACDVLVISGHFNAGDVFYSDKVGTDDYLRVDELERASCSNSCPALFSRLKEVYLFGCESLNAQALRYSSSYGESGRDRMRRIFANVPVIYGFSSSAPVGPAAAMLLNRYFDAGATGIGSGRPSARLLSVFSRNHMIATSGVRESRGEASYRDQVCQFFDERLTLSQKLAFVHGVMRRDMGEARAFFERIDRLFASASEAERHSPAVLYALAQISVDDATRASYLAATRATGEPALRSRMIALAETLGWLSPENGRAELIAMINDLLGRRTIGFAEVDLVCSLNDAGNLSGEISRVKIPPSRAGQAASAAVLACLGSEAARARILSALASADDGDVQVAQAYLRHRPVHDATELRAMAKGIARMRGTDAQVRALDTLGRLHVADSQIVEELTRSFAAAKSINVQRAIAEIFLRSGSPAMATPGLASVLRVHRIDSPDGRDLIDVLIGRLQASS